MTNQKIKTLILWMDSPRCLTEAADHQPQVYGRGLGPGQQTQMAVEPGRYCKVTNRAGRVHRACWRRCASHSAGVEA